MKSIYKTEDDLIAIFKKIKSKGFKEPRVINDDDLYRNKAPQLRAYWLLIGVCRSYMNSKGNILLKSKLMNILEGKLSIQTL